MSIMVSLMHRARCMALALCSSRMASATKGCLTEVVERVWVSLLTYQEKSTRASTGKASEKGRASSRITMDESMREAGATTRCMGVAERSCKMASASLCTIGMVISLKPLPLLKQSRLKISNPSSKITDKALKVH